VFHYGLGGELLGETVYDDVGAKIEERDYCMERQGCFNF
jgi:hypothetical protein